MTQALVAIDAQRASTPQAWVDAVRDHPTIATARRDVRGALDRLAVVLAGASERGSLVVRRLTWERMAELLECTTRTVARLLARLHRAGLLGRVASGRSAQYGRPDEHGELHGESAVYVLAVPAVETVEAVDFVDGSVTPSPPEVGRKTPARACARGAGARAAGEQIRARIAAGRRLSGAMDSMLCDQLPAWDREAFWSLDAVPATAAERLAAAAELRRRAPVLRRISARAVRSVTRQFFAAGWSVRDLLEAIDRRPDGTLAPHSGAHGVRCPRRWLAARLRAWRADDRTPVMAPSERRRLRRAAQLARSEQDAQERQAARQRAAENPRSSETTRMLQDVRKALRAASARLRHPHRQGA